MPSNSFRIAFDALPDELPIFPLAGVAVMPNMQVPLNIFEPRYLDMVFDSLGSHRMIGIIQPEPSSPDTAPPSLFATGTAGRISSFSEARNGRLMIILTGVCRFDIGAELPPSKPYRRVLADWSRFASDYDQPDARIPDREAFFRSLRAYCELGQVEMSWKDAQKFDDPTLIALLMTHLPFDVNEKQALIESIDLGQRIALLQSFLEMSNAHGGGRSANMRH
jgi:Lon protease-like protein